MRAEVRAILLHVLLVSARAAASAKPAIEEIPLSAPDGSRDGVLLQLREADPPTSARAAEQEDEATTADLSKAELGRRKVFFGLLFSAIVASLAGLGLAAVYKKKGQLVLGPLSLQRGTAGVLWRGRPLCGSPAGFRSLDEAAAKEEVQLARLGYDAASTRGDGDVDVNGLHEKLLEQERKRAEAQGTWCRTRRLILSAAFLAYVGTSVGIPLWKRGTVSCSAGFFWEDHAIFFGVFALTKLLELALYVFDPTITGNMDVIPFMLRFAPSFVSYADGYTDATAITIASACGTPFAETLASWMLFTYVVGVVLAQWIMVAALAQMDGTQACLMKLVHMDALAASVTLQKDKKWIWTLVNLSRTFAEDLPQAVLQALFCLYVKPNYWMILSVAVSAGSSIKALHDAMHHAGRAIGAMLEEGRLPSSGEEGRLPSVQAIECHTGDLVDKMTMFFADGSKKSYGNSGGNFGGRFALEEGEELARITGTAGDMLDSVQFHTSRGRASKIFGNRHGGNPFELSAPSGHEIIGLHRDSGYCRGIRDLVTQPSMRRR